MFVSSAFLIFSVHVNALRLVPAEISARRNMKGTALSSAAGCLSGTSPKTVIITAMSASDFQQWKHMAWMGSIFEHQPEQPVWLFTDDEWDEQHGRLAFNSKDLPYSVCLVDNFKASPDLHASNKVQGPIDDFYDFRGFVEPWAGELKVKSGKFLIRKVTAIMHALTVVPDGTRVLWVDNDVVFGNPIDSAFEDFVDKYDFTYIPFGEGEDGKFGVELNSDLQDPLDDHTWRVESGVISMTANERSRKLVQTTIAFYMGGSLELAKKCVDEPCAPWVEANLYMDDIYVWTLALRTCTETKQGWFSAGCKTAKVAGGCPEQCTNNTFRYPALCRSETKFTSPFNVLDYFDHRLHGPYSWIELRRSEKVVDPEIQITVKDLNLATLRDSNSTNDR